MKAHCWRWYGGCFGATTVGFSCLAIGLTVSGQPVSRLVPLVNMSTLVTVILGLLVFKEYKELNTVNLLAGSILIVAGGAIVSRA